MIFLRAGYKALFLSDSEENFTFGFGLNEISVLNDVLISFEYAYQNFVHLRDSNRFTLSIKF